MCAFGPKVKSSVRWCSWLKKRLFTVLALARALQILTIGCLFAMADRPFLFVLEQGDALVRTDTYLVLPLIMLALITLTRKYFFGRWPISSVLEEGDAPMRTDTYLVLPLKLLALIFQIPPSLDLVMFLAPVVGGPGKQQSLIGRSQDISAGARTLCG